MNIGIQQSSDEDWLDFCINLASKKVLKVQIGGHKSHPSYKREFDDYYFIDKYEMALIKNVKKDQHILENISQTNYQELVKHQQIANDLLSRQLLPFRIKNTFNSFDEQFMFWYLHQYYKNVLSTHDIKEFYFPVVPHGFPDYVLYAACDSLNIKTYIFTRIPFIDGCVCNNTISNIFDVDLSIEPEDDQFCTSEIERLATNNTYRPPDYWGEIDTADSQDKKSPMDLLSEFFNRLIGYNHTIKKIKNASPPHESDISPLEFKLNKVRSAWFLLKLKRKYECIATNELPDNYVYFALHYQPELTTLPLAGIYRNQYLAVAELSDKLPSDWDIIVKEHPGQFQFNRWGEQARTHYYYDLMSKIDSVSFVSLDLDSFTLIDNAIATASVGGTVGFESVLRGKPTFVWRDTWYSSLSGCTIFENVPKSINQNYIDHITSAIENLEYTLRELSALRSHFADHDDCESNKYACALSNFVASSNI